MTCSVRERSHDTSRSITGSPGHRGRPGGGSGGVRPPVRRPGGGGAGGLVWARGRAEVEGVGVGGRAPLPVDGDLAVMDLASTRRQDRTYFRLDRRASPRRITLFYADSPSVVHPVRVRGVTLRGP